MLQSQINAVNVDVTVPNKSSIFSTFAVVEFPFIKVFQYWFVWELVAMQLLALFSKHYIKLLRVQQITYKRKHANTWNETQ
jgi:hypothetical protein